MFQAFGCAITDATAILITIDRWPALRLDPPLPVNNMFHPAQREMSVVEQLAEQFTKSELCNCIYSDFLLRIRRLRGGVTGAFRARCSHGPYRSCCISMRTQPGPLVRSMFTLLEGAHWLLVSAGERAVSVSPGPASKCLRVRGYGVRWRGVEEHRGRLRDRDFCATQGVCLSSPRRTWVAAAVRRRHRWQL